MAEKYQTPVFILNDQFMADSYRAVKPFDLEQGAAVFPRQEHDRLINSGDLPLPYERYALTEDGVSPRLLPGLSEHLVVADSDEHTSDGHLTEDLEFRVKINEKRLKKEGSLTIILLTTWSQTGHVSSIELFHF